jgi:peptide/nickel transport system permease protein
MGRYLITSVGTRDYTVIQAIAVVIAIAVIISNLVVDILYAYLDPRIRYG